MNPRFPLSKEYIDLQLSIEGKSTSIVQPPSGRVEALICAWWRCAISFAIPMETVETHCEDRTDDITPYTDSCGNSYGVGFGLC